MSARASAFVTGAIAIALVVAQHVVPRTPLYHRWQYALALAIGVAVLVAAARRERRGAAGARGALLAYAGAAIVAIAGLASGVLGPDTAEIVAAPGTVAPLPALGAAAFFAPADPASIARGDGTVTLRRRDGSAFAVGSAPHPFGESVLYAELRPAAYVEAWDARGAHLTVTQPANASFLSAVVLFRQRQRIGEFDAPFDTVATPALHRVFRLLYFTPADLARFHRIVDDPAHPATIVSASDDRGAPLGVTLVRSGRDETIGGVRLRVTLGTYPVLAVAAAPPLWAVVPGVLLFAIGIAWCAWPPRRAAALHGT